MRKHWVQKWRILVKAVNFSHYTHSNQWKVDKTHLLFRNPPPERATKSSKGRCFSRTQRPNLQIEAYCKTKRRQNQLPALSDRHTGKKEQKQTNLRHLRRDSFLPKTNSASLSVVFECYACSNNFYLSRYTQISQNSFNLYDLHEKHSHSNTQ